MKCKRRTVILSIIVIFILSVVIELGMQEGFERSDVFSYNEEQTDAQDPYWAMAEELLKDYVPDNYEVSKYWVQDTQYLKEYDLQGTKWMLYECLMENKDGQELDVPFCVWVEKTENGYTIQTDFKNNLFRWALLTSYYEYTGETSGIEDTAAEGYIGNHILMWELSQKGAISDGKGLLLWASLPADSGYASPYYGCLGEDMILCSQYEVQEWEPVFKAAYEKMYEYQKTIHGDLSQKIRFSDNYDQKTYRGDAGEEKSLEDFENAGDYQTYMTAWTNNVFRLTYETWRENYEKSGGVEYMISFDKEYGIEQTQLLELMCEDLRLRLENAENKEKAVNESENNYDVYTVQEGDSLWKIAEDYYGNPKMCDKIYEDNKDIIGNDKNYILPDIMLRLYR